MRITYLYQYFQTPESGGSTRCYEMAKRLAASGHQVNIISTDFRTEQPGKDWRVEEVAGCSVHRLPLPYSNSLSYAERISVFLRFAIASSRHAAEIPADVIFATSTPLTVAIPAIYASWRTKVPYVFEVRDMWPDVPVAMGALANPLAKLAAYKLEALAYSRAAHVVALAPGMAADIVAKGVDAKKLSVIPNGADLDIFTVDGSGASELRSKYGWLKDRKVVLYAGAIGKVTGVEYLVRVAAETLKLVPDICFVVIGEGADRAKIEEEAQALGVLNANLFIFDHQPKSEVAKWVQVADVMACLIAGPRVVWKDAVQNKFFDALAGGKPTFCNFDGWQTQIAADADAGFMTDRYNEILAAKTIVERLHDQTWLERAGAAARHLAITRFDRDILTKQLEDVLYRVLRGGRINPGPESPASAGLARKVS